VEKDLVQAVMAIEVLERWPRADERLEAIVR
jgi:hypothetical protein